MATAETRTKKLQPWKDEGLKKDEWVAREVAKAVNAGKAWDLETVDFADPNRPPTCLEVDFPIIPINQIAAIEGNAGKPIYQMSKWWARRRSSVFRSMLLAAAIKAPDDPLEASKLIWDVYYGNHQKKGIFKHLKVADIFMGGGTTIVEGARLGMRMLGNDLNPVAWFVVKNQVAPVDKSEIQSLLADIEAEIKPQLMPFYACDCPRGHKGKWTRISTGEAMREEFDPVAIAPDERKDYRYDGPEVIYSFWAKHGPCQVTGCGHRTPIMPSPVIAVKEISTKYFDCKCPGCWHRFHAEFNDARMAPSAEFIVAEGDQSFTTLSLPFARMLSDYESGNADERTARLDSILNAVEMEPGLACPKCHTFCGAKLKQTLERHSRSRTIGERKKKDLNIKPSGNSYKSISLSLLLHPEWLKGEASKDDQSRPYGGRADDAFDLTARWNDARAAVCKLVEVRGTLPDELTLGDGTRILTGSNGGTIPSQSSFSCGACGTPHDILDAVTRSRATPPMALYAVQGYCPCCEKSGAAYAGRFFLPHDDARVINAATNEALSRCETDLAAFIPTTAVPEGFKTSYQRIQEHGYPTFAHMFSARQLYGHALIVRSLIQLFADKYSDSAILAGLGCLQQYLRNQNLFCLWNIQADKLEPHFSTNNYYPKNTPVENSVFSKLGRGNWKSCAEGILAGVDWREDPWELVPETIVAKSNGFLAKAFSGKSIKTRIGDGAITEPNVCVASSTDLEHIESSTLDLVITDPPFGNNVQYAELADFFHVWLRLSPLYKRYIGDAELTPKNVEAVVNPVRNPDDPHDFYTRTLTLIWQEAARTLKPSGILAFTFHHSEDEPWVSVLQSLFDAGFLLECAYPIRSDETKGEGAKPGTFGSQLIEYDIIHVCRQRHEEPKPISWAKLRRKVLRDVRELQALLEHHQEDGGFAGDSPWQGVGVFLAPLRQSLQRPGRAHERLGGVAGNQPAPR
jgi:putative DNA methylase